MTTQVSILMQGEKRGIDKDITGRRGRRGRGETIMKSQKRSLVYKKTSREIPIRGKGRQRNERLQ